MKGYPKYKESGVPWLGEVPEHWEIHRGKYLFKKMARPVRDIDEVVTCFRDGTVTLRKNRRTRGFTESLKEIGYQGVRKGDLVIHQMDAFAGAIGVSDSDGKGTPVYSVCCPTIPLEAKYYAHIVREMSRSEYILSLAKGIRERSTDFRYDTFGAQFLPMPPIDEQNQIARYLDWQTAKINRFIRNKKRLIALLREQRQNVINRAVTRGIDPAVKMKESGVEWLGEIPEYWEVRRVKTLCERIIDCKNRTPPDGPEGRYRVIRTSDVRDGKLVNKSLTWTTEEGYKIWTQRGAPKHGDVFFTREAPCGEACLVPEKGNLCLGQRMMYFRPNKKQLLDKYLLYSIYGPSVKEYIKISNNGSTVGHLRVGQVHSIPIVWCPLEEQQQIVDHIEKETSIIDRTISRTERELELIEEYRTRLISDVVTGRVDIRHIEVPDFEPVELESGEAEEDEQIEEIEKELEE